MFHLIDESLRAEEKDGPPRLLRHNLAIYPNLPILISEECCLGQTVLRQFLIYRYNGAPIIGRPSVPCR
jgi:hypothetical protein